MVRSLNMHAFNSIEKAKLNKMEQSIINFFGPPLNEINSVRNNAISGIIK